MIVIFLAAGIVFSCLTAWEFYEIAKMKGFKKSKYFWIPFLFPIFGYQLVIALPDLTQRDILLKILEKQKSRFESDELPDL